MTKISRGSAFLLCAILGIALLIGAVCSFALSPLSRSPTSATTESADSSIGNLYNTNGTLNASNVAAFLVKLQYNSITTSTTLTSPQIADRAGVSTNSFIFQMGYYVSPTGVMDTSKPLTWQATYLRNGYLTIWLNRGYTKEYFANGTATESNGWKTSSTSYSSSCNDYSHSLLREVTKNIGNALINKFNNMNMIVVSPQEAGATWQATQANAYYSGTKYSTTNGLQSNPNSGSGKANVNPQGWDWDSTTYNDKFWNPSHVEIYNQPSNSAASRSNGLWGLSFTDINASNSLYDGQTASDGACWLRSGASINGREVIPVYNSNSGDTTNDYVLTTSNVGVRPACHISLSALDNLVGYYGITASVSNGGADKATVDKTSDGYYTGYQATFVFTSLNSNYITGLTINNANITISASSTASGNFTQTTGCQYKAYRNAGNQVTVIVTNVTQDTTITAINSTITPSVSSGSGTTATVAATSASGGPQYTYTFTSYENYYINRITINGTQITISDTTNTNFNTAGNTSYYCYRNQNQVILVVKDIIQNTNIIGYYNTLFTITSANPTLVLQDTTTYTRANYFDTAVDIVATFEQNENIQFTIDGVTIRLQGKNSTGEAILPSGKFNYSHNVHNNYVVIRLTNLPNPRHDVTLDHYVGDMEIVNITSSGGSGGLSRTYIEDSGLIRVVFSPTADNEWVYSLRFDNVEVMLTYYKAELYGVGGFSTIRYIAKDSTNTVTLEIDGIYESTNITFNLTTSKPNYQVPPTNSGGGSFGVAGTVVAAGIGGEARIVGNDIANGTADDTVTFVALAYTGYRFVGWVDASNETEVISTSSTAVLSRDEVNGKVIKALFEEIPTNSSSNGSLNGSHDFV